MISIIIAAGYATRLGELTKDFPKPLLKIGQDSILDRMIDDLDNIEDIRQHIIVTNHKFAHHFQEWKSQKESKKEIIIVDDGTTSNETRLGAVRDIQYAISELDIKEDIIVVAADNLLFFSFKGFVEFYKKKKTPCIIYHTQKDIEKLRRTGVITIDADNKVLEMEEKPSNPKSHFAVPPFYIYPKECIPAILKATENGCGTDAPGNLVSYLLKHTTFHAWPMADTGENLRFDIGSIDTYNEACEKYGK